MNIALIIPSRYGATRLPGKPLKAIAGKTLINRVWSLAIAASGVNAVYVATDDERIADHVSGFGGVPIMTPANCENGTERVYAAATTLNPIPTHVINLQGDAVLTPPWVVERLMEEMVREPTLKMVTPAVRLDWRSYQEALGSTIEGEAAGTTVTFDQLGNALYFSKGVIPFVRRDSPSFRSEKAPVYWHVGMYGYRLETLQQLVSLQPGPLERTEKLEQLRALEYGIPIRVVEVDYRGRSHGSIDIEDDICRAEAIILSEGDLLQARGRI
ncbi:3-deoxy-manno-octulosonate cytidylyltransferase [Ensifer aridi]|uniref:3-deoxy-manno-octulosonate cytidylyltransferase n=1 Tax=Ensifer aridi TaxID=1708715 RepID=UPI00047BD23E|nr:3-deoxy-manno-octulosonate cytidylyltransferase [Ensifer aridi]